MNAPAPDRTGNLDVIVRICQSVDPKLSDSEIFEAALGSGGPKGLARLSKELTSKPDLLVSGRSDASPTAFRLIMFLRARGHDRFRLPQCSTCGTATELRHKNGRGGKHCDACNRDARNRDCSHCGQQRAGGYRMLEGRPYCRPCFLRDARSRETCSVCGELGTPETRNSSGPVCKRCYTAPPVTCTVCAENRPAASRPDGRPVCMRCYQGLNRRPRTCSSCGRWRISPHLREEGAICGQCVGEERLGRCAGCGNDQQNLYGLYCARCVIPAKVRALITDQHCLPHPKLMPLETYLLRDGRNAQAVLTWVQRSPMASVVKAMATGNTEISLRAVAGLPNTRATGYFAALLMEAGVVPTDNFDRVRLEVWQKQFFASLDKSDMRSVLQRYASWAVNPRFSNEAHLSRTDESRRFRQSKAHLVAVTGFLLYVDGLGLNLASLPQRMFDDYVVTYGRAGAGLTPFIRWARNQGLCRVRSEYLPQRSPGITAVSDDQRWAWVRFLLNAGELGFASRVGGLLMLLYGITATRVVSIHLADLDIEGQTVRIGLGSDPIELPEALASLVRQLLDSTPRVSNRENSWLFVGRRPGRHLTTAAMTEPLRRRGINPRAGRSTALINLARDIPPSVLASLLGISIHTATRWAALSGRDWIDYPRIRLAESHSQASPVPGSFSAGRRQN